MTRSGWLTAAFVATALGAAGCASSPFYNEARDKQGQTLTKAAAQVDLTSVVDELDKRFGALRQLELQTLQARMATQRQLEIAMAATPGSAGNGTLATRYVVPLLENRIERLVGRPLDAAALDNVLTGVVDDEHADAMVARALRTFNATSRLTLADCAAARHAATAQGGLKPELLVQVPTVQRGPAQTLLKDLLKQCETAADAKPTSGEAGGELQRMAGLHAKATAAAQAYRRNLGEHRKALKASTVAFEAEVSALTPNSSGTRASERLAGAASVLASAIGTLREAAKLSADAFGHAEAAERLEALDAVVGAVASGSTDLSTLSAEQKRAVGIVRLIPGIADDASALLTEARKPRLAPLLLAKEQQRLAVQGFEVRAALLERRATLRQQQLQAVRSELQALARARRALGPPPRGIVGVTVDLNRSFDDAVGDSADGNRRRAALFESLATYFDLALHHRGRAAALELAFNGTTDEDVMLQSRSASAQWGSLMSHMAAVIAEYHAAGIKPADLAEFLKGFGLVLIGQQAGK